ncbi:monofunctional biosynthetic peptidoglycan transglycosylase [Gracilimonas sp.]|uniref:monofunctional biosynthetic peptidoglycan transglycosylase n=1 Tax=Gracilimonas sp. TaxID=1974203 RepID=UPI003BAA7FCD
MEKQSTFTSKTWRWYGKVISAVLLGWSFWFCLLIISLRWVNPPVTAFTFQENWEALGQERYNLRESWVPDEQLPEHLKLAVIASEDQRFREHWGLDLAAIDKALEEKERSGRVRGASTITQQVAKNLFLSPTQTYLRKAVEAGVAVLIELFWTKDRILEVYLNIAEFGPGMFGVEKASRFYYGISAPKLTPKQSARMATVLPSPKRIEPEPASEYVMQRSQWILRNMQQLSGIRYLPKPKPDTTDTLKPKPVLLDSVDMKAIQDSLGIYLDSILMEIQLDSVNN